MNTRDDESHCTYHTVEIAHKTYEIQVFRPLVGVPSIHSICDADGHSVFPSAFPNDEIHQTALYILKKRGDL